MPTKTKPKRKQKSIARLLDDAAVLLQKIRRIESADEFGMCLCVTCGNRDHWKSMNGGHYIPRTKTATKIVENNINVQCPGCNCYRQEEAKCRYAIWMIETYGYEYVKWLEAESRKEKKYTRPELEGIIVEFKERLARLSE